VSSTPAYRRLPAAARRESILAAATELIASSAYAGVSLAASATAAGMTRAGLLHHFPSKEDLLVAVLNRLDLAAAEEVILEGGPSQDPASARARVDRLVAHHVGTRQMAQLSVLLSAEALDPSHPAHEFFRERLAASRATLAEELFSWHPQPDLAAVQLLAFLDGLLLHWLRDPEIDLRTHWAAFADYFFAERASRNR